MAKRHQQQKGMKVMKVMRRSVKLQKVQKAQAQKVQRKLAKLMAKLETTPRKSNTSQYIGVRCPLRVGSDCAGLMSESLALINLGVKHRTVFISELNPTLMELLKRDHPDAKFTADLTKRDDDKEAEYVDLYSVGAPCQPWSPAGKQQGNNDKKKRHIVLWKCIHYIHTKLPRAVVAENSHALAFNKFKEVREKIISLIESYGYKVWWKVLNTMDYGIPQHRKRLYLVAIKNEAIKRNFQFPSKTQCLPLNLLLEPPGFPGRLRPPSTKRSKHIKKKALKQLKAKNIIPCPHTPCVIDVNASKRFASKMARVSPSLTATRCTQNGHYIALRKGMMRLEEMCRLQGFHPSCIEESLDFLKQKHSEAHALRVLKHAIGNAMSVNVLMAIMSQLLPCAGLVSNRMDQPSLPLLGRLIDIPKYNDSDWSEDDDTV